MLENRNINDDEKIQQMEKELEETIRMGEEADKNYEEVTDLHVVACLSIHVIRLPVIHPSIHSLIRTDWLLFYQCTESNFLRFFKTGCEVLSIIFAYWFSNLITKLLSA